LLLLLIEPLILFRAFFAWS